MTWPCFTAVAVLARGGSPGAPGAAGLSALLLFIGTFAPGRVAVWLTVRARGEAGVRALLGIATGYFLMRMPRRVARADERAALAPAV